MEDKVVLRMYQVPLGCRGVMAPSQAIVGVHDTRQEPINARQIDIGDIRTVQQGCVCPPAGSLFLACWSSRLFAEERAEL